MKLWVACLLASLLLVAMVGALEAQEAKGGDLESIVKSLDSAVVALRRGGSPSPSLEAAKKVYENKFSPMLENVENALNTRILGAFGSVLQSPSEENIFALRADIIHAAGLLGISVSPLYSYSIFIIAGIAFFLSYFITLLHKRTVNWELVNRYKTEISQFMREYREILRRQDRKRLHKLEPRMKEIRRMQGVVFSETMKPALYYFIPLVLLWWILGGVFSGWVVAWLPFSLDLPIFGRWVACGFGWWYLLTYLTFSTILRGVLIPESRPAPPAPAPEGR
jgi:uncharacterized membrane protein (DUF106 family)